MNFAFWRPQATRHFEQLPSTHSLFLALILLLIAAFTSGASARDRDPVWRLEMSILTGDVSNAGTDNRVRVALNGDNETVVDYGRDDFERADGFRYDLNIDDVATIGDIDRIEISKSGTDGWCVKRIDLWINNVRSFIKEFDDPCLMLDNDNGNERSVRIESDELRDSAEWADYRHPNRRSVIARGIPRVEMESRIEAAIGDGIATTNAYWGDLHGRAVEVRRKTADRLTVDLDLSLALDWSWDREYDVDFDLFVRCEDQELKLTVENWTTESTAHHWYQYIMFNTQLFAPSPFGSGLAEMFFDEFDSGSSTCPIITIETDGSIAFEEPEAPRVVVVDGDYGRSACTYEPRSELLYVSHIGERSENGRYQGGSVSALNADGTAYKDAGVSADEVEAQGLLNIVALSLHDDILYVAAHVEDSTARRGVTPVIAKWNTQTQSWLDPVRLPDLISIIDLAAGPKGGFYLIPGGEGSAPLALDAEGKTLIQFDAIPMIMARPSSLAVDTEGNVVFVDDASGLLLTSGRDGTIIAREFGAEDSYSGLAIASDGTRILSSARYGTVTTLDKSGQANVVQKAISTGAAPCYVVSTDHVFVPPAQPSAAALIPLAIK